MSSEQTRLQRFSTHFSELTTARFSYSVSDRDAAVVAAFESLAKAGMIDFLGVSVALPDPDPIVEVRALSEPDDVNALLLGGWRMIGAALDSGGLPHILVGRPRSVASDD